MQQEFKVVTNLYVSDQCFPFIFANRSVILSKTVYTVNIIFSLPRNIDGVEVNTLRIFYNLYNTFLKIKKYAGVPPVTELNLSALLTLH